MSEYMSTSAHESIPGHRVALRNGWSVWRWMVMRSAGFPASTVLQFGLVPAAIEAIDELLRRERAAADAFDHAIAACVAALEASSGAERKQIGRALERLRARRIPDAVPVEAVAIEALRAAVARCEQQRAEIEEVLASERVRTSTALRELAHDPLLREAIVWQNRSLVATMLDPVLEKPVAATDSHTRQKEATLAGYAQRYAVKNDTIGFFGPVGWAHIGDGAGFARIRPGRDLLDLRHVHFEYWCMDALAAKLASDPALRRELAPRWMPTVRLVGDTVHFPIARSARLDPEYAAVLAACDGRTPAHAIAQQVGPAFGLDEAGVFELLEELVAQRLATWTLEIPTAGQYPERELRALLEQLPEGEVRAAAFELFDRVERARADVARAAGDWAALDRALRAFDELFSSITELAATRRAGQMYAGRTLLYEDTRRDVAVDFGADLVDRLALPMSLVCASARWYTHEVERAYRPIFRRTYDELHAQTGHARIDYLQYVERLLPHFAPEAAIAPTVQPIVTELQARWVALLGATADERRIERDPEALRPRVAEVFAAPHPGWPQARFHSPDLMIAATDLAAVQRGELSYVVNEIHVGAHTFTRPMFLNLHDSPDELLAARRSDLGQPIVVAVETRANALRSDHFPPEPGDIDIQTTDARSWRAPQQVIDVAQLVIDDVDGRLVVCTRDGAHTFDVVEVFEAYLQLAAETHFNILPPLPHMPRVQIGGLVVARESWTFAPADIAFAAIAGTDRFIAARRWATQQLLPRFIFMRLPEEPKPCFVDLESPLYVENMARMVRKASRVQITEMLPAIDHVWLPDAAGRTYTSELRMVMVDPVRWRPPLPRE